LGSKGGRDGENERERESERGEEGANFFFCASRSVEEVERRN